MPLYEYKCAACGDIFEVRQKFSDEPLTIHEGCGGAVERLISAPAIQFKGSGWYVTDYARAGSSKESEAKDSKAKDSSSKDSSAKEGATKESGGKASKNGDSASSSSAKSEAPASTSSTTESKK